MPRVLILYGTTEGHTRAIARAIAEPLSRGGVHADVMRAGVLEPVLRDYDAIIVAASVHAGRYQKAVEQWVRAHANEFGARPTAFVSVSLAVLQHGDAKVMADLDAIVSGFSLPRPGGPAWSSMWPARCCIRATTSSSAGS